MTPTETHQLQLIPHQQTSRGECEVDTTHHDTEDAVRGGDDRVARPARLGGEELGRDGVEDAVHDVARERVAAVPAEERVGRARGRAREEEHPGDDCVESVAARGQVQVPVSMLGVRKQIRRRGDALVDIARVPLRPR